MSLKKNFLLNLGLSFLLSSQALGLPIEPKEQEADVSCIQRAQWISPKTLKPLDNQSLLKKAAKEKVVLLGEQHPDAVHHRWQLQTITQLYAHNPNIIIGFEMFPRRIQPVLDAWVRGELSEREFLEKSDWNEVWKHDADIYMPLFRFARMNRLPIVALNVEMGLIGKISQKGWDGIDEEMREGVKTPRSAHPDYIKSLKEIFSHHSHVHEDEKKDDEKSKARFKRFVDAQLTWDGAMAQALAHVQKLGGDPLMVGIMGSGHLANRYGVPHQLEGLGLSSTVLLPWTLSWDCKDLSPTYADAIFGLEEMEAKPMGHKPMLGVRIDESEDGSGVRVDQVIEESVAEDAGLEEGDIITMAAGVKTLEVKRLISIIQRQAPGTWLPLSIMRDGDLIEIIAKFPKSPH
ncbi:conserved exported hypothetical protein [Candidatus Terasakiella magnetica]|uniref:PDZ domain-containing protein n=1 Tax=Candidatus Terasakiella magnetica TaxID=1867952 RepID=A0A1C3RJW6_9PROT|nr:ChaN family lipoprotein [Candidatus Terasakiella magnetica]SCA57568.1 conserved exported hypothetical protein [Candidatus Terasakiella magnetica]